MLITAAAISEILQLIWILIYAGMDISPIDLINIHSTKYRDIT